MVAGKLRMSSQAGRFSRVPHPGLRSVWTWTRRSILSLIALLVILATTGMIYQQVATRRALDTYPPPGEMVDMGGYELHLLDMGAGHEGPTVVLLAGASSMSLQWAWIQRDIAEFARVVSYDRAGLGWSEESDRPSDARTVAVELHALLETANIPGPYVLVGHSLGGAQARVFADLYRDEVAGMVLIDAGSPDFWTEVDDAALEETRATIYRTKFFPILARFGLMRLMNPADELAAELPADQQAMVKALFPSVRHMSASRDDFQEVSEDSATMEQLRALPPVGDLPVVALTRTEPEDVYTAAQQQIDSALAETSTRGEHRLVAGADHFTIVTDADYAGATTAAVRDVLHIARDGMP